MCAATPTAAPTLVADHDVDDVSCCKGFPDDGAKLAVQACSSKHSGTVRPYVPLHAWLALHVAHDCMVNFTSCFLECQRQGQSLTGPRSAHNHLIIIACL